MEQATQLSEFGKIAVFLILGVLFVMVAYGISQLLTKSKPSPGKLASYECGEEPEGDARMQFNSRFYVIALVFLLFDVEIVFLFPWSAVFAREDLIGQVPAWGWLSFTEMMIFVAILLLGLLYVWVKGDLRWIKPRQVLPVTDSPVPMDLYQRINAESYTPRAFSLEGKPAEPRKPPVPAAPPPAKRVTARPSGTAAQPGKPWASVRPAAAAAPSDERTEKQEESMAGSPPDKDSASGEKPLDPPARPAFKPRILKKDK